MTTKVVATSVSNHTYTLSDRYNFRRKDKILGIGSYGVVAAAFDEKRKRSVAIKRMRPFILDQEISKVALREMKYLMLLGDHPNVSHTTNEKLYSHY